MLAQPGIDKGFTACGGARIEHVPDGFLVEADQGDDDPAVCGEPSDHPYGGLGIERVSDSPELMSASLADSLEGRRFFGRLGGQVGESLEQGYGEGQPPAAPFFGMVEPPVELVGPVDDHIVSMSCSLYNVKFILPARWL